MLCLSRLGERAAFFMAWRTTDDAAYNVTLQRRGHAPHLIDPAFENALKERDHVRHH